MLITLVLDISLREPSLPTVAAPEDGHRALRSIQKKFTTREQRERGSVFGEQQFARRGHRGIVVLILCEEGNEKNTDLGTNDRLLHKSARGEHEPRRAEVRLGSAGREK